MRLEKLTIQGFKSFADRLEFDFVQGITAIVGPNGSGKSNVIDAIRWVLGEQSIRTLRGECLEDIIFSGSSFRRPHGLAEVTLVFNNEGGLLPVSYNEVTVTRRAYRSGTSDFLLNGVSCRLRDIQDLFADTGMGKQGYAYIGQGKVDEVLSLSPQDRRVFLEQAAGVWKWRRRKKETQDKLHQMEQDLVRIGDICSELEGQRGPLEEDSGRTKDYLEKKGRLRTLHIYVGLKEIKQLQEKIDEIQIDYVPQKERLGTVIEARVSQEEDVRQKSQETVEIDRLLDELKDNQDKYQQQLTIIDNHLAELIAGGRERAVRKETAMAKEKELEDELIQIRDQQDLSRRQYEELKAHLTIKGARIAELAEELEGLEGQQDEFQRQVVEQRERTITLLSERSANNNAIKSLERERQTLIERLSKVKRTYNEALDRAEIIGEQQKTQERVIEEMTKAVSSLEGKFLGLQGQLSEQRKQEEKLAENYNLARRTLERLRAEHDGLEKIRQQHRSYGHGPRSVLIAKRQGIIGSVAQLLIVKPQYEVAIEVALGGAQQFIVAQDDQVASSTIDWLRQTKGGRATFLPLNTIRGQIPSSGEMRLLAQDNVIGWASELVHYSDKLQGIAKNLLGRVLVTKDLAAAREAAKSSGYRVKVVTLLGDVVNVGGSLSGGSYKEQRPSQLSEERRLRELAKEIDAKKDRLNKHLEEANRAAEQRKLTEGQLEQLLVAKEQDTETLRLAASKKNEYLASYEELERTRSIFEVEINNLKERAREIVRDIDQLVSAGEKVNIEIQQREAAAAQEITDKEQIKAAIDKLQEVVLSGRLELATLEEKEKQLSMRIGELELTGSRLRQQREEMQENLKKINDLDLAVAARRDELNLSRGRVLTQLSTVQKNQEKAKATLGEARSALEHEEQELTKLLKLEQELRSQVHQKEISISGLEAALSAAQNSIFESHGVPIDTPIPQINLKVPQARAEIKQLTEKMDAMGEVNLRAPQMLAELMERLQFYQDQVDDVQEAKQSLLKLISDIDKTVSSHLMRVFEQLRSNFINIFGQLFEGGHGDLQLAGDDPQEAGLEIYAQLPGKKEQPLSLLSGGERALTAIAFLFALLRCGTTTLCVLDEIDAPLDEINAERFLSYLEKLAKEIQFIVATHRKAAMARADTLYGLSMAANGVSSIVSVDLTQMAG